MSKYIMVIDEGTTGTRGILFDKEFKIVSQDYQELIQYTPDNIRVEHDASEIYNKSVEVCKGAMQKIGATAEDISCIGIATQRNTCVIWDKNTGEPLYHAIVWQDTRTGDVAEKLKENGGEEKILRETGKVIAPHNNGLILKWCMENVPEVKEAIEKETALYGTMDTWLIWKLTEGKTHAVACSNASSSGCVNVQKGVWNEEFIQNLGVPLKLFPTIASEASEYGVTKVFGKEIPITGAIADQQSALFAQGCLEAGTMKCTNGTGSFMDITIGNTCKIASGGVDNLIAWKLNDTLTYMVEGFVSVTGSAVQWLRDGLKIIRSSGEIEALAASVPDTNGVYFVPALVGLTSPHNDPSARGTIIGITRGTTDAHIARATLECIAFGIKDILDVVEKECEVKIDRINVDGGASQNNLLLQMLADYCNADVVIVGQESSSRRNGTTGPQIAEFMHYPCITNVVDFHIENNTDIWIKRNTDEAIITATVKTPVVLIIGEAPDVRLKTPRRKDKLPFLQQLPHQKCWEKELEEEKIIFSLRQHKRNCQFISVKEWNQFLKNREGGN